VAAFDLDWGHGSDRLRDALNAHLPDDLAVRSACQAADDFHPRFDASSRQYRYRLFCGSVRDPLRERYAWRVWPSVSDLPSLERLWTGTHDFAAFGSATTPSGSTVRTVLSAGWHAHEDEWTFEIRADAFLYRMVRRLVYVQVAFGQGRLPAQVLSQALDDRSQVREEARAQIPAGLAPAYGLTLVEVCYDNLIE
jgi:tRNA pseudouridine38-40 synthase